MTTCSLRVSASWDKAYFLHAEEWGGYEMAERTVLLQTAADVFQLGMFLCIKTNPSP